MPRIVIHAGFHKTGTTTAQNTLRLNADALAERVRIYLKRDMKPLCEAARGASQTLDELNTGLLRYEAASLAESWEQEQRVILLASEDLSGHMPGRRGLKDYSRAPAVLKAMIEGFEAVLKAPDIALIFTTRAAAPWLASCYAQHLKATRMTMDQGRYLRQFAPSADLKGIVEAVSAALPYPVQAHALEDCTGPLGPLDPVLALAGLKPDERGQLTPAPHANLRPSQAKLDKLLALNRSDLSPEALKVAKRSA